MAGERKAAGGLRESASWYSVRKNLQWEGNNVSPTPLLAFPLPSDSHLWRLPGLDLLEMRPACPTDESQAARTTPCERCLSMESLRKQVRDAQEEVAHGAEELHQ